MKKLTAIILLMATFFAGTAKSVSQSQPNPEKLVLNNGAKWRIDKPTSNNVINLQQFVNTTKGKAYKSLNDYHNTGNALQTGISKMIRDCRMKGPDHLALHKWLEPLMEQVAKINSATTTASAKKHFEQVKHLLNIFNQYFQV